MPAVLKDIVKAWWDGKEVIIVPPGSKATITPKATQLIIVDPKIQYTQSPRGSQIVILPPERSYGTKITLNDLRSAVQSETGVTDDRLECLDTEYYLYPLAVIDEVFKLIPQWSSSFGEGKDCDDQAQWYQLAIRKVLPGCPVLYILSSTGNHAFIGVVHTIGFKLYMEVAPQYSDKPFLKVRF
jgi:hypothetical protein